MSREYVKKVEIISEESLPEARAKRLRRLRNMANLTRQQMCDDGSININTLKGWEIARYGGLPKDGAEKIIKRVAREGVVCTLDWLLHEGGTGPYVVPVCDNRLEQNSQLVILSSFDNDEKERVINEMMLFKKQYSNAIDFEIQDNSMEPIFRKGDVVAGVKFFGENIIKLLGVNCVVCTGSGEILFRKLKAYNGRGRYTIAALNDGIEKPVLYDVEVIYAAPVQRHYCLFSGIY